MTKCIKSSEEHDRKSENFQDLGGQNLHLLLPPDSSENLENSNFEIEKNKSCAFLLPKHRRCRSQGNPPKPNSNLLELSQASSNAASNESITSLFYPFSDQPDRSSGVGLSSSRRTCISLTNSPSGSNPYLTLSPKPIKNPSTLLRIPSVRTLPSLPFKMESIIIDKSPLEMSNLSNEHLYLNGFDVTIEELDELYKVRLE